MDVGITVSMMFRTTPSTRVFISDFPKGGDTCWGNRSTRGGMARDAIMKHHASPYKQGFKNIYVMFSALGYEKLQ